jgi:photosystem II stability/assembly factor-like uncharacterized protein
VSVCSPRYPFLLLLLACARGAPPDEPPARAAPSLVAQQSGTTALLQAVSVVSERVAWVSGHRGTYAWTRDGGQTWRAAVVPGADTLQFRDVHAVDSTTAYLLSAGNGELSRIYKTGDAGRTWALQFTNRDSAAFFDCMDFWDAEHGVAFSDAVGGRTIVITTADGGAHWTYVDPGALPAALPGEGGFAASGTCVIARGAGHAWIGTGNGPVSRVLRTADRGRTWSVATTPLTSGRSAGITSLAFRDTVRGVALGGRIGADGERTNNVAVTADGGRSWRLAGLPRMAGAIYGGAFVPGAPTPTLVAVGPGGADLSVDGGATWTQLDTLAYWGLGIASERAGWLVGPNGRIVKVAIR